MRNPATEETRGFSFASARRLDAGTGGDFLATLTGYSRENRRGFLGVLLWVFQERRRGFLGDIDGTPWTSFYCNTVLQLLVNNKNPGGDFLAYFRGFLGVLLGISWRTGYTQPVEAQGVAGVQNLYILYIHYKVYNRGVVGLRQRPIIIPFTEKKHGVTGFTPYPWDVAGNSSTPGHLNPWTTWTEADDTNPEPTEPAEL